VDNAGSIFDAACEIGAIVGSGAWYDGYGIRAQGSDNFIEQLRKNPEIMKQAYDEIIEDVRSR
jgi:hypothetical protein